MNLERIAALAALTGNPYLEGRLAFLSEEPALPDYPYTLAQADPRFRVQYLILQGWQQNAALYQEIDGKLRALEADTGPLSTKSAKFMSKTAAGFNPLYNSYARQSAETWKRRGLPYAWEMVLKFQNTRPHWQISTAMFMISGFPHDDSVDALLVALRVEGGAEHQRNAAAMRLREMPKDALRKRLTVDQGIYIRANGDLQDALRGR